ncbi:MAG: hypothetical protein A3D39_01195 [Candidatus Buchananbacteria bacterium RIFCSPHIGHO2_02_FULL_39_17]|nr:MAG: hypothetical protein A3D39_01195 [Candidatus Buchananbacteria bacterium RIFCSPHIGHO2_02_FULL_39_17]
MAFSSKNYKITVLLILGIFIMGAILSCASFHHSTVMDSKMMSSFTNSIVSIATIVTECCVEPTQQYPPVALLKTTVENNSLIILNIALAFRVYGSLLVVGLLFAPEYTRRIGKNYFISFPNYYLIELFSQGILHPRIDQSISLKTS